MQITGHWHAPESAARAKASLVIQGDEFELIVDNQLQFAGSLAEVSVSDRLGNLERKLVFPDDSVFSSKDNTAIDSVFKKASTWLHKIESNLAWVGVASLVLVATIFAIFRWGIPWLGHTVAHVLPADVGELIGENTLDFLDDAFFSETQLDESRRDLIRSHFLEVIVPKNRSDGDISYKLHFRAWGEGDEGVANALALPSGDIILTDRFVELSENQSEIDAVLLHEMGHVEHRHTLEMITQTTLMAAVLTIITGDAGSVVDAGVGLGSLLITVGYARDYESEADQFAFKRMMQSGIDPIAFANIMTKITAHSPTVVDDQVESKAGVSSECSIDEEKTSEDVSDSKLDDTKKSSLFDYLSTHPATKSRIEEAMRYSDCFKENNFVCLKNQLEVR